MTRPPTLRQVPLDRLKHDDDLASSVALRWLISCAGGSKTLSASQQIAAQIGSQIVQGTFAPGAPLPEQDLSSALSVSRGPIREALRILEREGLVRILSRRGAHVTRLSIGEVRDLFEIRATLFGRLVYSIASKPNADLLIELEEGLSALRQEVGANGDADDYALQVFRLTLALARGSRNVRLREMVVSVSLQTLRYSKLGFYLVARRRESFIFWREVIALLRAGDAPAVRRKVENHIEDTCRTIIAALRKDGAIGGLHEVPRTRITA